MTAISFKSACGRVLGADGIRGTGFLIARDLLLTCHHIVQGRPATVTFDSAQKPIEAVVESCDATRDWSLLRLRQPVEGREPLTLSTAIAGSDSVWEAYGFPAATGEAGLLLKGELRDAAAKDDRGRSSLQLYCSQLAGKSEPQGFSGSPVVAGGQVVGMLQAIIPTGTMEPQFGTLYASPASALHEALIACHPPGYPPPRNSSLNIGQWRELLTGMPASASGAARSFLAHYLGTAETPVAFGGRSAVTARLLNWIENGRPYLLLTAPTGLGKSAVVCRLVDTLCSRRDLAIAFLPVSQRFGTNLAGTALPCLLDRLAILYGVARPTELTTPVVSAWLAQQLRQPLPDGRRLVLVIDGLDEAADWSLTPGALPVDLPPTTRVLVSARETADGDASRIRSRLALGPALVELQGLAPLDRTGVQQALRSLEPSLGPLSKNPLLINRLYELSEGDPLVLELLLEELQTPGLQAKLLSDSPDLTPGLDGIWKRMVQAGEQSAFVENGPSWRLISVLVCALAPLPQDELIELTSLDNVMAFDQALQPVRRWVLGLPTGYSFSHVRLREFLFEKKLTRKEKKRWLEQLLTWSEGLQDALPAAPLREDVPEYILQAYAGHLLQSKASVKRWLRLLSGPWQRAWMTRDMGTMGLARDVDRAIQAINEHNESSLQRQGEIPFLRELLRGWLWKASIRSAAQSIPHDAVEHLLESRLWSPVQALAHAQYLLEGWGDDTKEIEQVALAVIHHLPDTLLSNGLELATSFANSTDSNERKLWKVLLPRAVQRMPDEAAAYARCLIHPWHHAETMLAIAAALPTDKQSLCEELRREGLKIIQEFKQLPQSWGFLNAVERLSYALSAADRAALVADAYAMTRQMESDPRINYLLSLLDKLGPETRLEALGLALEDALKSAKPYDLTKVIERLSDVDVATARHCLHRIVTQGRTDGVVAWLWQPGGLADDQRWLLLRSRMDESYLHQIETALFAEAATAWYSAWNVDPLAWMAAAGHKTQVLQIVRQTEDTQQRRIGTVRLAALLDKSERLTVWREELQVRHGRPAERIVERLIADAAEQGAAAVEDVLLAAIDANAKAMGMLRLAAQVPESERLSLLEHARQAYQSVNDPYQKQELLLHFYLLRPTVAGLHELIRYIEQCSGRTRTATELALRGLASQLEGAERQLVYRTIFNSIQRLPAHVFIEEATSLIRESSLDGSLREEIWARLQQQLASQTTAEQSRWLLQLLPQMTDPAAQKDALLNILRASKNIDDLPARIRSAAAVCGCQGRFQHLVDRALELGELESRFHTLTHLARCAEVRYPGRLAASIVATAVEAGRSLLDHQNIMTRAYVMHHGTAEIRRVVAEQSLARVEEMLGPHLETFARWRELTPDQTKQVTWELHDSTQRDVSDAGSILEEIGPSLLAEEAELWLARVPLHWTKVVVALLKAVPGPRWAQAVDEAWQWASSSRDSSRGSTLAMLIPFLPETERSAGVDAALAASGIFQRPGNSTSDNRAVVLSHVAAHLRTEHLTRAIEIAKNAWPGAYNSLHIFLGRLSASVRREAMDLLASTLSSLDQRHRSEVRNALGLYLWDKQAALALLEYEVSLDTAALDSFLQAGERWTNEQFLQALNFLRSRRTGCHEVAYREAEYRLVAARISNFESVGRAIWDHVRAVLAKQGRTRPSLLQALESLGPSLRALAGPDGADSLVAEVLHIEHDWP